MEVACGFWRTSVENFQKLKYENWMSSCCICVVKNVYEITELYRWQRSQRDEEDAIKSHGNNKKNPLKYVPKTSNKPQNRRQIKIRWKKKSIRRMNGNVRRLFFFSISIDSSMMIKPHIFCDTKLKVRDFFYQNLPCVRSLFTSRRAPR